jgi:putative membrane protein
MGLANLVPGISGGTMLLAAGVYPCFIEAVAEVTTLRFRPRSLVLLGSVVVTAGLAILLLAGAVKGLVVDHRWVMYSIFIGLTLGGVPVVWKLARPATRGLWVGAGAGFAAMVLLALAQQGGGGGEAGAGGGSIPLLFLAGVAGAAAMILPGVSGGYLLLVLGQYVPILASIDRLKDALAARDFAAVGAEWVVIVPVGVGVLVGVVGVSNLLRLLLHRYEKPTLGVLLGLLLGAVVGLWPFQQGVEPEPGQVVKGQLVTADNLQEFEPEDWPVAFFSPRTSQVAGSIALIIAGFGATFLISKVGNAASDAKNPEKVVTRRTRRTRRTKEKDE